MTENVYESKEYSNCITLVKDFERNKSTYVDPENVDLAIAFAANVMKAMIALKDKLKEIGPGWLDACGNPLKILSLLKDVTEILDALKTNGMSLGEQSYYKDFEVKDKTLNFAVNVFNVTE